jgi:GAF domain-containing protein
MKQHSRLASGGRIAVVSLALGLYGGLLYYDAVGTFSASMPPFAPVARMEIQYGFSALIGFTYLAVGLLVSLYIRERALGIVLLVFCCGMAATFATETASLGVTAPGSALQVIADVGSATGLCLFAVLPLLFPHNYLSRHSAGGRVRRFLRALYLSLLLLLYVLNLASDPYLTTLLHSGWQVWPEAMSEFFSDALAAFYLTVGFATLLITHRRHAATARERLQVKLVAGGTLLAFLPFLVLTLLLTLLGSPYAVDAEFSTLAFGLVPIALGYAILRYHLLTPDRHIRSAVTLLVGGFCLALGAYLVFLFSATVLTGDQSLLAPSAAVLMLLLIPFVWWIAPWVSTRVFAPDLAAAHRLMYSASQPPQSVTDEDDPIEGVARLLMRAARSVLGAQRVCFLAFHKESDSYHPVFLPAGEEKDRNAPPHSLLSLLVQPRLGDAGAQGWLDARDPLFVRLAQTGHPLLLSEARDREARRRTSFARVLAAPPVEEDPLLVPLVTSKGTLIGSGLAGVLVLGARDTYLPYAGPDLALIDVLLARFSWLLEAIMLDAQTRQHVAMLSTLSAPPTVPLLADERTFEELARAYTEVGASAMGASAEIWFYDEQEALVRRAVRAGTGPFLRQAGYMMLGEESDWTSWFYEGEPWPGEGRRTRTGVVEPPGFPFAWLPLRHGERPFGVLVLTYPHPHHPFAPAERQILELFANQLATALASARLAWNLRAEAAAGRERARFKGEAALGHLQQLLQPLVGVQRALQTLHMQHGHIAQGEELPVREEEAARATESFAPALAEALPRLVAATREALALLHTPARTTGQTPDPKAVAAHVRWQVNAILRGFEAVRQPEVLVIAADADFGAMLVSALSLDGYSPKRFTSLPQALLWVQQRRGEQAQPAALILDSSALPAGVRSLIDFTHELEAAQPASSAQPPPPLVLVSVGDPWTAHLPEQVTTLEAPFAVHTFLERVQDCISRAGGAGD